MMTHPNLHKYIKKTPILTNDELNEEFGCELFFKCENLQNTGSFKFRGACNAILNLKNKENGVITISSGNHGAALAKAANLFNIKSHIILPKNSSKAKIANIKKNNAVISFCENDVKDRKTALDKILKTQNYHFISPYNDHNVISGQSSVAKEMLEEITDLNAIISPISGGGLISGTIISRDKISPSTKIYGAEPIGANDAFLSLKSGKIIILKKTNTICDGLRACLGDITYEIIKHGIESIITPNDDDTLIAMKKLWQKLKIIVEPSSAITLAAVMNNKKLFKNQKIGLILTGGNVVLKDFL